MTWAMPYVTNFAWHEPMLDIHFLYPSSWPCILARRHVLLLSGIGALKECDSTSEYDVLAATITGVFTAWVYPIS